MRQTLLAFAVSTLIMSSVFGQPSKPDSLSNLLKSLSFECNRGDSILGIKLATKYIKYDSLNTGVYLDRGIAYNKCYVYNKATADFNKARSLSPTDYRALYNLGFLNYRLNNFKTAIQYFDSALVLNTKNVLVYHYLANSYGKLGDNQTALKYFGKAQSTDSTYYKSYKDRGITYNILKKYELAIKDFDNAIRLNPTDYELYYSKSTSYYQLKQFKKSIQTLDKAKPLTTNPIIDFAYGASYIFLNDTATGCKYLKIAVDKNLKDAEGFYQSLCASRNLDCNKLKTGKFYYPQIPDQGYTIRDKKSQTSYYKDGMTVTWNVKWTSNCAFELSFEKAENTDRVFGKSDRISVTITSVDGDCYTFKSVFFNDQNPNGQEIPPGQMCIKKD